ncbi:MAG: hypothetical protein JKY48_06425 [Flavobacteriales bacterium]|nr:hypothetical protein [Flavobacteriales bacterium]
MIINLYTTFCWHSSQERNLEYLYCLQQNIQNKHLNNVFVLSEKEMDLSWNSKLSLIRTEHRPTFADLFSMANDIHMSGINIVCNSDIFFTEFYIQRIVSNIKLGEMYALSRWDIFSDGRVRHHDNQHSQDSWIYLNRYIDCSNLEFMPGKAGCDNRLAFELRLQNFRLLNPSKRIRSFHYHLSQIRDYKRCPSDTVAPPYLFIPSS